MKPDFIGRISLEVSRDGKVIFQSDGHWLHPLLDLTELVQNGRINLEWAEVHDKIVGRAAALLILRLGAVHVHGDLMSELAVDVLQHAGMPHSYNQLIRRIDCATEEILQGIDDPEEAYLIVRKRAGRN
jgi:hypothetical protein